MGLYVMVVFISVAALILIIIVLSSYWRNFHWADFDWDKFQLFNFDSYGFSVSKGDWGTFGDFVGGTLNPILSFLALMVLLRTFSMQREELDLQREELKDTKAILKEQSETQKRQQFESTFFELLKVHNQALESCQSDLQRLVASKIDYRYTDLRETIIPSSAYSKAIKTDINDTCGHYFRVLYQLLKFIANSNDEINKAFDNQNIEHAAVVSKNEKMYSNIVRALLTDDVMKVLSMNCYCEHGKNDVFWPYKLLIERYAFFEHASFAFEKESDFFSKGILRPRWYYSEKAFGNQTPSQSQENP
jgi:hypothetical protein